MKSNKLIIAFIPFALFLVAASCNQGNEKEKDTDVQTYSEVKDQYQKPMIEMNKEMLAAQDEMIRGFISRRKWNMTQTESGLYYEIYFKGKGKLPAAGNSVEFAYKTYLLDGTLIYSSDSTGNRELLLGHNNEESGLDEGLRLLHVGDKAHFILHPHLAFGVPGDGNLVPYRAILIYDVELVAIKN